jgi:hypothetical protein
LDEEEQDKTMEVEEEEPKIQRKSEKIKGNLVNKSVFHKLNNLQRKYVSKKY